MRLTTVSEQALLPGRSAAENVCLLPSEVHIWWVGLQLEGSALCACWDLLSPEETRLASSHRFVKDLREFVVTRAVLRQILAQYTGRSAADLRFDSSPGGKPVLRGMDGPHFSVSHCSDLALLAVARFPIGIDVEHVRPGSFWESVIADCLCHRERAYLDALPARSRSAALYRFWTQKEAILKAVGTGLLYSPQEVSVLPEGKKPSMVSLLGRRWVVRQIRAPRGYAAAVALEPSDCKVRWRQWRFSVSTILGHPRGPVGDLPHLQAAESTPLHI